MFNISNSNQSPTFTSQCDDKDSRCPSWAAFQNQCTTNREFMNRSVKLSQIRNKVKGLGGFYCLCNNRFVRKFDRILP